MSELGAIGGVFAIFCRVGCCFMLLPGFSSMRVPGPVRLWLSIGISLALGPLLLGPVIDVADTGPDRVSLSVFAAECAVGLSLGLVVRIVFSAVQMTGALIAQVCGYNHPFTTDDGQGEPTSEFAALLNVTVIALLMVLDLHHLAIAALLESYSTIRFGSVLDPALTLEIQSRTVGDALRLALTLASPFLIASIMINFAFGMLNRMAPQLPVFFIATAFLIGAMLWMAIALLPTMASIAMEATMAAFQRF